MNDSIIPAFGGLLTPDQVNSLRSVLDRIIPADDYPSACDAGVDNYLAGQLRGDLSSFAGVYRDGLDGINREAVNRFGVSFAELDSSARDSLLSLVEKGGVSVEWTVSPSEFFSLLVGHAMEGYYGTASPTALESVGFDPRWTLRSPESVL